MHELYKVLTNEQIMAALDYLTYLEKFSEE